MIRNREILNKHEKLIGLIVKISGIFPNRFYQWWLKVIRNHDNYAAMFIRFVCLKNCAEKCGNNVAIFSNVYLYGVANLEIGDNVSIHPLCYIDASGGIRIEDDVSIAHNSTILSSEHVYSNIEVNIKDQGVVFKKTTIENNVWVGSGVRILGGSHIKSGSIVGAGAVVKGRVNCNSIIGGVPAKLIKVRE